MFVVQKKKKTKKTKKKNTGPADRQTDRRSQPLIEMRSHIFKKRIDRLDKNLKIHKDEMGVRFGIIVDVLTIMIRITKREEERKCEYHCLHNQPIRSHF